MPQVHRVCRQQMDDHDEICRTIVAGIIKGIGYDS
jgi:hypothetical protein